MDAQALAQRCAEHMWADDRASQALGMTILEVGPGHAKLQMTVQSHMVNGHAIGHGGYTFTLADSTFAFACNSYNDVTVAAGCDINYLAPTREGDVLTATGREAFKKGRSGITDVAVVNQDGVTVALFRGRSRSLGRPMLPEGP